MSRVLLVSLITLVLIVLGCNSGHGTTPVTEEIRTRTFTCDELRTVRVHFHGDPQFEENERAALVEAMLEWKEFTGGRVNFTLSFERFSDNRLWKVDSSDPRVKDRDAELTRDQGFPGVVAGWREPSDDIFFVMDRIGAYLKSTAMHELGHVADMQWQRCLEWNYNCRHTGVPGTIMYESVNATSEFTPTDLLMCQASCICPK